MSKQTKKHGTENEKEAAKKVRLDKWLWSARIYKTRGLAKTAIDGGKVHCGGVRAKASKEVTVGLLLTFRQGWDEKTVEIVALSEHRRGAAEAIKLYQETENSREQRLLLAEQRKAQSAVSNHLQGKPNKKDRRLITRFKQKG